MKGGLLSRPKKCAIFDYEFFNHIANWPIGIYCRVWLSRTWTRWSGVGAVGNTCSNRCHECSHSGWTNQHDSPTIPPSQAPNNTLTPPPPHGDNRDPSLREARRPALHHSLSMQYKKCMLYEFVLNCSFALNWHILLDFNRLLAQHRLPPYLTAPYEKFFPKFLTDRYRFVN